MNGLAFALLVPACGYFGAKNRSKGLLGCFTCCRADQSIAAAISRPPTTLTESRGKALPELDSARTLIGHPLLPCWGSPSDREREREGMRLL